MAYTRMNVYPDGDPIPKNLPESYMPAAYGAPAGQNCFTCAHFSLSTNTRFCNKWNAPVKPKWWCAAWTTIWPTNV